ncbi:MAG: penicillin-binding transpeptidase domain-containing protein, partial [Enterobacteriaceae bacterium]
RLGDKAQHLSGAKVFTTLDPVSQDAAEKAVSEGVPELRKERSLPDLEGAMVVVDRLTGEIRALVGGVETQYAGFNRATNARRSIGSLAKPPVYLTALSEPSQYRLNTWLADQPLSVAIPGSKSWEPKNYDRRYRGQVMLVDSLASSLNIPTVNLGMTLGVPAVVKVLEELGVDKSAIEPVPAMFLGALNLTPIEVAQMYQTLGSGGNRARLSALRSVIAEDGTPLYQSYAQSERTIPAQPAYLTLYGMQQAIIRGTGRALSGKFGKFDLAGKTGTTNDLRDSWFAGIDGSEVAIAWVGRDNNEPTRLTGATGALKIYRHFLDNQMPTPLHLQVPENIIPVQVDDNGNFVCSGSGLRTLPVWSDNLQQLCTLQQGAPLFYHGPGTPLPETTPLPPSAPPSATPEAGKPGEKEDAPAWVKEMFGQN